MTVKISNLPAATSVGSGDVLPVVQSGTTKKIDLNSPWSINIDGGNIDGTPIGVSSASSGAFTTLTASDDVNFDSGTLFVDASADAVGIGTTSPNAGLHLSGTGPTPAIDFDNTTTTTGRHFRWVSKNGGDFAIQDLTASTEPMLIDSNGNVLIGKTSDDTNTAGTTIYSSGYIRSVQDGIYSIFNRTTSDGEILRFQKDGSTFGSIGVTGNDILYIRAENHGLKINSDSNRIDPCDGNGDNTDGVLDLGTDTSRFKDLYLSGGAYLGGTSAANKLDDYEEGSFTPAYTANTPFSSITYDTLRTSGYYRKIGSFVFCLIRLETESLSGGSGNVEITGLPFTCETFTPLSFSAGGPVIEAEAFAVNYPSSLRVNDGTNAIRILYRSTANGGTSVIQASDFETGSDKNKLNACVCYIAE